MTYKTIQLLVNVNENAKPNAVIDYAIEFLFGSGRPLLVVPQEWEAGPILDHVVVAWDGGARAARAIGDAVPL